MRWFRGLTSRQRAILLVLLLSTVAVISLLAWSVWRSLSVNPTYSPLATPFPSTDSPLLTPDMATATRGLLTPTVVPIGTPTGIPGFDVSQAGLVSAAVSDARQMHTRWGTPLSLVGQTDMARAIYRHYQDSPPLVLYARPSLVALRLWFWDVLRLDVVGQSADAAVLYMPETQELLIRRDWEGSLDTLETQLAYGYARALPDQYGDLTRLTEEAATLDHKLALMAVAEGDAFVSLLLHQGVAPNTGASAALKAEIARAICPRWQIEDVLLEDLTCLAFQLGTEFAVDQYLSGGTEALDDVILRPPWSTEQVMNRERYAVFEQPRLLSPPALDLGAGWVLTTTETLGQAVMSVILTEWGNAEDGEVAVMDWGGDLLQVWEGPDDRRLAVWQIVWDEAGVALDSYGDLIEILPRALVPGRARDVTAETELFRGRLWSAPRGALFLDRRLDAVWVVWGTDRSTVEAVAMSLNRAP